MYITLCNLSERRDPLSGWDERAPPLLIAYSESGFFSFLDVMWECQGWSQGLFRVRPVPFRIPSSLSFFARDELRAIPIVLLFPHS